MELSGGALDSWLDLICRKAIVLRLLLRQMEKKLLLQLLHGRDCSANSRGWFGFALQVAGLAGYGSSGNGGGSTGWWVARFALQSVRGEDRDQQQHRERPHASAHSGYRVRPQSAATTTTTTTTTGNTRFRPAFVPLGTLGSESRDRPPAGVRRPGPVARLPPQRRPRSERSLRRHHVHCPRHNKRCRNTDKEPLQCCKRSCSQKRGSCVRIVFRWE